MTKKKLASIRSAGAKQLRGRNEGLLRILNKNLVKCPAFLCEIHQQALFSKEIEIGMNSTMNITVKVINKIRGGRNALTYRKFKFRIWRVTALHGSSLAQY